MVRQYVNIDGPSRVGYEYVNGQRRIIIRPPEKHGEEWGSA